MREQLLKYACPMEKIERVLLVEDNDITILITKKMIEKTGLVSNIDVTKNGKEAYDYLIEHLEKGHSLPDVILLDIMMPVWDGWTFLRHIKHLDIFNKTAIYLYTSSISDEDKHLANDFGLENRYLVKPIHIGVIQDICAEVQTQKEGITG